jgi:hypothetical protein
MKSKKLRIPFGFNIKSFLNSEIRGISEFLFLNKNKNKKSQAWGLDLLIALMIFIIGLAAFFLFYLNYSDDVGNDYESLSFDGNNLADSLFSEGNPPDWNSTLVVSIGLLTGNSLDPVKLENFYYLSQSDYQQTKAIFNTNYDYFFFLDNNLSIDNSSVRGIGKPGVDLNNIEASNLIKINRITTLNNQPVSAYVYVWEN